MSQWTKIIVTGDAGRGKTALAEKLSKRLGIPHHSTDDYFYDVKFSKSRERDLALEQISEIYKEDKWIVEGTTAWLLEPGMSKADIIIYLQYKNIFSQWFILVKRYFQRESDTIKGTLQLMRHVLYKRYGLGYKKGKMTHAEFIEPHKERVVHFSSFREIDEFLNSLQ